MPKWLIGILGLGAVAGAVVFMRKRGAPVGPVQASGGATSSSQTSPGARQRAELAGEPRQATPGGGMVYLPPSSRKAGFAANASVMSAVQSVAGGGEVEAPFGVTLDAFKAAVRGKTEQGKNIDRVTRGSGTQTYNPQNVGGPKTSDYANPGNTDPGYYRESGRSSNDQSVVWGKLNETGRGGVPNVNQRETSRKTKDGSLLTVNFGSKSPGAVKAREAKDRPIGNPELASPNARSIMSNPGAVKARSVDSKRSEVDGASLAALHSGLANAYKNAASLLETGSLPKWTPPGTR